jgi:hypothetical protein
VINPRLRDLWPQRPTVSAQGLDFHRRLPLIMNPPPLIKSKGGIHLGNRSSDWNPTPPPNGASTDLLAILRGDQGGTFPASLVVMSNQVYDIQRNSPQCTSAVAVVRNRFVFNYLLSAVSAGTKIVIRIYPSPGNFEDAEAHPLPHQLITQPSGGHRHDVWCTHLADATQRGVGRISQLALLAGEYRTAWKCCHAHKVRNPSRFGRVAFGLSFRYNGPSS